MRVIRGVLLGLSLSLIASPALASEILPFGQARFAAAQREGRSILVEVQAPWCPTCAVQKPLIEWLAAEPEFKNLIVFTVDYDTQKAVLRRLHAPLLSTLIAFRGRTEVGRSIGDTDINSIERLLQSSNGS